MALTLSDIRTRLRILIDQPHTATWSNTNLNYLINDSYHEVVSEIIRRHPHYYHKSSTVSSTASTPYTDIPSDCIAINKILNSDNETLAHMDLSAMDTTSANGQPEAFAVTGPHIFWWPTPDAVYVHTIYYHYRPSDISGDTSCAELPIGYEDILAYGAAIKTRMAKEDQIGEYHVAYEKRLQLLLRAVAIGQTNQAPRIKGSYNDFYIYD